jgi:hypothetical protein
MELNKTALDRWITREPDMDSPVLVTAENWVEMYGSDLMINELECAWSKKRIGYSDHEDNLYYTAFYHLNEDGVLVEKEIYEEEQARIDAYENELDRQEAQYRAAMKEVN